MSDELTISAVLASTTAIPGCDCYVSMFGSIAPGWRVRELYERLRRAAGEQRGRSSTDSCSLMVSLISAVSLIIGPAVYWTLPLGRPGRTPGSGSGASPLRWARPACLLSGVCDAEVTCQAFAMRHLLSAVPSSGVWTAKAPTAVEPPEMPSSLPLLTLRIL